jgi:hypothetical protein
LTNESKYHNVLDDVDPSTRSLLADLEVLHDFDVPDVALSAAPPARPPFFRRHLRPLALAAAAAAAIAVFLAAPSLSGNGDGTVSAQTILERSQRAATTNAPASSAVRSYHLLAEHVIAGDGAAKKATIRTETWYQDEEHVRTEERNAAGTVVFGQLRNAGDFWIHGIFDANTIPASGQGVERVVHGPAGELSFGKMPVETGSTSLAALLANLTAKDCFDAAVTGDASVTGRDAYVIDVTPAPGRCPSKAGTGAAVGPEPDRAKLSRDTLNRLWVDKDTFITLRSEFYADGELLSSYAVLHFDVEPVFAAGTFAYQPGPGVQVIEVGSLGEAKQALAGILQSDKPKDGAPQPKMDANVPPKPTP